MKLAPHESKSINMKTAAKINGDTILKKTNETFDLTTHHLTYKVIKKQT